MANETWKTVFFLNLAHPLHFGIHFPGQHKPNHLVVAHERPERVLKRCWSILLDEEVTNPGGTVAGNEGEQEQPPTSRSQEINQKRNADCCAEQMEQPRGRLAMFIHIVRPKVRERMECFFAHRLKVY